ncbi:MAG: GNAT family N-acetyltransferase [Flavobacteriales bacterium]|nr:GNAT family N-acetyltransferase [Flavobacteriales bacterium]MCW8911986.1 GNAT family N-acetyltransferase [Flavobacteriales bacterium]MCW8937066.1 GNAT family N-acetyltransferase [Flavobacteriales bacterium]MCW8940645.1 GNAT family N-acetyltransferase [Flavobacteriales bacterium]MCW8968710.1 GNAT family N-acetyltransferase [Flavobacteriales bacterium]
MTFILNQYGISLKRINKNDIELIRKWRNHPNIRKYMGYKKKISEKEQIEWFKKVNNPFNYYFLIIINDTPIGVINCKDVNINEEYGEGGIFIWDDDFLNTPYPIFASLILLDFIFNELKIGDKSFIRILPENSKAIKYNKMLGYVLIPGQEKAKNQWYILTKESYNKNAQKLRLAAKNYTETDGSFTIIGEKSEVNLDKINTLL